ncbi:MAG: ABC transporter ATP-binding protein [Crocinitomicaceae bacterium]
MSILQVKDLTIAYQDKPVVKKCSFEVAKGEVAVILGSSGDGKTTVLKAIAGLLNYQSGDILFLNEPVKDPSEKLVPGHELIKLVNQDFDLDTFHTVEENIRLRLLQFNKEYQDQRVQTLLRLTRLTKHKDKTTKQISGGQQQRLAIARALADEPELLLLDEPFNQLDFQTKNKITKHLRSYIKKHKIAVVMVTHNGIEAMEWADKIIYLENGRVKRIDEPRSFFEHPKNKREASFFGEINRLKIGDEQVYFRPSFYSLNKSKTFKLKLKAKFVNKEFLGWYSIYTFSHGSQKFKLFSTEDLSTLKEVFIQPIKFND